MRARALMLLLFVSAAQSVTAAEPKQSAKQLEFFENKIRPVLVEHCYRCHSADAKKLRGGLLLDTRAGIRKGGETGPAVVPQDIEGSLLISALRHESFEMPPDKKLPDQIIADFEAWIREGAPDPRDGTVRSTAGMIDIEEGRKFWAFQAPRETKVPEVGDSAWPRTNVDRYILARLEAHKLQPVIDADSTSLIRRAYYALIGLPPSPEEITAFEQESIRDPQSAFGNLIDRLLESQHFGERWGRHWLDVVRFAESSGGGRTLLFPDAWRYRDYVIESFNHDVPYDRFLKEQIAGDLMEAEDWRERRRQITATAFLVLGPTNYELQDKAVLEMDIVDEQLDTIGKAMLGMTIGCARCHDHKFDPIPARDYYALAGILKSTKSVIHSNVSKWNEAELPIPPEELAAAKQHEAKIAALQSELKSFQLALKKAGGTMALGAKAIDPAVLPGIVVDDAQADKKGPWTGSSSVGGYVGASYLYSGSGRASVTFAPRLPKQGRYEIRITYTPHGNRSTNAPVRIYHEGGEALVRVNQRKPGSIASTIETLGFYEFDPKNKPRVVVSNIDATGGTVIADAVLFVAETDKIVTASKEAEEKKKLRAELAKKIKQKESEIKQLQSKGPKRPLAMAVTDLEEVGDIPLAIRGVVHNSGPIVPRGVLQVTVPGKMPSISPEQSGRMELANWITRPDNPLTARIMVNRVWYWLFGKGLVRTVDNFGATGDEPSHPELLDYLATEFVADDWSVKRLIRRIMLSRTYQLSSANPQSAIGNLQSIDPDNRLLSRMNRQRLDAESIRDALFAIGGNLDVTLGGSNIKKDTKSEYGYEFTSTRRSVYVPVFRNSLPQIFATFDFADPNIQVGSRTSSTTAPQALLMMNHPLVMQQSEAAANRLLAITDLSTEQRIDRAYQQVLGRLPSEREVQLARRFIGDGIDAKRWTLLYQALLQSLDFRFVD